MTSHQGARRTRNLTSQNATMSHNRSYNNRTQIPIPSHNPESRGPRKSNERPKQRSRDRSCEPRDRSCEPRDQRRHRPLHHKERIQTLNAVELGVHTARLARMNETNLFI